MLAVTELTEQILFTTKNSNKMLIKVNTQVKKPIKHKKNLYKETIKMKYFKSS